MRTHIQLLLDQLSRSENYRESDYAHQYWLWQKRRQRCQPHPANYGVSESRATEIERRVMTAIQNDG